MGAGAFLKNLEYWLAYSLGNGQGCGKDRIGERGDMKELTAVFLLGIAHCETRGERDPVRAVGRDGLSFGVYQITDVYREDVNRVSGRGYVREDCFDPVKSGEMVGIYLRHYATEARLGHEPEMVEMALIHHHGPGGWRRPLTDHYAVEFLAFMKQMGE